MCTVLLPTGDNPVSVNKYIIPYQYGRKEIKNTKKRQKEGEVEFQ